MPNHPFHKWLILCNSVFKRAINKDIIIILHIYIIIIDIIILD